MEGHLGVFLIRRHDQTRPQFGDGRGACSHGITPLGLSGPQVVAVATTPEDVLFRVDLKLQQGKLLTLPSPRPVDDLLTAQIHRFFYSRRPRCLLRSIDYALHQARIIFISCRIDRQPPFQNAIARICTEVNREVFSDELSRWQIDIASSVLLDAMEGKKERVQWHNTFGFLATLLTGQTFGEDQEEAKPDTVVIDLS